MANYDKTTRITVRGKGRWTHVQRLNKFGDWSTELYPIPEDLEVLRELQSKGLKNTMMKDEDGYYMRFKRPPKKDVKLRNGEIKTLIFAPPTVAMADGTPLADGVLIGNGSDLSLVLEVYPHATPGGGKAVAARLEGVRVDNLVPFNPQTDYQNEEEKAKVDEVTSQPERVF